MAAEILFPKLGMTMDTGRIVGWLKKEGDVVKKGEVILEIESDKVTFEVESQGDGFLMILFDSDHEVPVGTVIGYIATSREEYELIRSKKEGGAEKKAKKEERMSTGESAPISGTVPVIVDRDETRVTPAARRIAKEKGIDLSSVQGTGPGGKITREDILAVTETVVSSGTQLEAHAEKRRPPVPLLKTLIREEPLQGMRATISRRMMESLSNSAQVTAFCEWDATNFFEERERLICCEKEIEFRATIPGLMAFLVSRVLRERPIFNASIEGERIKYWADVNIGIAVSVSGGLVVPVLRQTDKKNLKEIHQTIAELIDRARSGKLLPDEMVGGTFTINNVGTYGGDWETVILNPPEVAMLAIGNVVKKPVVVGDSIVIREMMPVSFTFDHRLIDGASAGEFRMRIKELVESPDFGAGGNGILQGRLG